MKLLLSIDGGGVLGIGPAEYLANLEMDMFLPAKAYAGSSVGALLVALASSGMGWTEILQVFQAEVPRIFAPAPWSWRINPGRPRFDGTALRIAARKYFGNMRMCDLKKPTFITSFDFRSGKAKVFDITDGALIRDAIVASASAPTYFPIADNGRYGDGGLVANNPSMVGIAGLKAKHGWHIHEIQCLSLGTNGDKWKDPKVSGFMSKLQWVNPLIETMLTGNEELATFQAQAILANLYMRVEPVLSGNLEMDDLTILEQYRMLWGALYNRDKDALKQWLRMCGGEA